MGLCAIDTGENELALARESLGYVVENGDLRPGQPCYGLFFGGGKPVFEGVDAPRAGLWVHRSSDARALQLRAGRLPDLS